MIGLKRLFTKICEGKHANLCQILAEIKGNILIKRQTTVKTKNEMEVTSNMTPLAVR